MRILGIESSCDETAAAVVEDGRRVLSEVVRSQIDIHRRFGGPVPEIASRSHLEVIVPVIEEALERAGLRPHQIDAVAVTHRPGLIGALLVGLAAGKAFALSLGLPLIGVHHVAAHIYGSFMDSPSPPETPYVALVVSGGHTSLFLVKEHHVPVEIGATADDAAGEAFDKVAAILKLGYPGGPAIERAAEGGDPTRFRFKPPLLSRDGIDFSFSGIKTAVLYRVTGRNSRHDPLPLTAENTRDVAAAFQEAVVEGLLRASFRAVLQHQATALVVGGGCSANARLRLRLKQESARRSVRLFLPPRARSTDNAVMIAGLGYHQYQLQGADDLTLDAYPS